MSLRTATLFVLLTAAMAAPALADARQETLVGISRCSALAADRAFLECIYGAAQPMRAQLGLPPAPAAQTALVPRATTVAPRAAPVATAPAPRDGLFGGLFSSTTDSIETYSLGRNGIFTITLVNGEMWRQDATDPNRARWVGNGGDYRIQVERSDARTARLRVMGDQKTYAMRRIYPR